MDDIRSIFSHFDAEGTFSSFRQNATGHINHTYICTTVDEKNIEHRYTLQRVNHNVFKNVDEVMKNIVEVTRCIGDSSRDPMCLRVIMCRDGKPCYIDGDGEYWRMYNYITDVICMDVLTNRNEAYLLGRAVAEFQKKLAGIDAKSLCVTIPDFHNMEFRYRQFDEALADAGKNRPERLSNAEKDIEFFKSRRYSAIAFFHDVCEKAPVRVTHNDAKLNNVLFSKDLTGSCVIDLDTVMPGTALFDTGDMLRTVTNTAKEDEKDLSKVSFNVEYYESLRDGYFSVADSFLTVPEKENFFNSGIYMTHIVGLRFLNDYLAGDTYFHTEYPDHNLVRSRTQSSLVKAMEAFRETTGKTGL